MLMPHASSWSIRPPPRHEQFGRATASRRAGRARARASRRTPAGARRRRPARCATASRSAGVASAATRCRPRSMPSTIASRSSSRRSNGFMNATLTANASRWFDVRRGASMTRSMFTRRERQRRQGDVDAKQRSRRRATARWAPPPAAAAPMRCGRGSRRLFTPNPKSCRRDTSSARRMVPSGSPSATA